MYEWAISFNRLRFHRSQEEEEAPLAPPPPPQVEGCCFDPTRPRLLGPRRFQGFDHRQVGPVDLWYHRSQETVELQGRPFQLRSGGPPPLR